MKKTLVLGAVVVAFGAVALGFVLPAIAQDKKVAKCPISGKPVAEGNVLNVNGKEVGFCCDKCPKAYLAKYAVKDEGPSKCPISGNEAKAEHSVVHLTGKKVAFCCGDCQKKYAEKNKLKLVDKGPTKCPLSGNDAKAETKLVVNGEAVYFCCNDCRGKYAAALNVTAKSDVTKCPVSGEDADEKTLIIHVTGEKKYFCCDKCPTAYVKKNIPPAEKKA